MLLPFFARSATPQVAGATIVVGFAREVVERVAQKVDVALRQAQGFEPVETAALPAGFGEHFGHGALEAGVVVADGQAHTAQDP